MFKKPVWDDLSFVTWCIILLEVAIEDIFYFIYLYRDIAQQKCCAKVSYKAHLHLKSLGRMLLQHYNIQSKTIQYIQYHIIIKSMITYLIFFKPYFKHSFKNT